MPIRRTLTVSITPEQDALIRACLHSGRFASASEVVRAALRLLQHDERQVDRLVTDMPSTQHSQEHV
ncbi:MULTISPECIES: type II toxin-antitoxin system ParD family antitoxin [Pseudomonas]|uniref:type II toxin-antitoxin system ParD family antitoxin n=1 Tax=Pseudomonas TaxID=286 RepID=UPI0009DAD2D0|nr:type II toxin-antitoxin system ParD family antitoxin [Pseudomonas sp. MS15a(2019)]